MKGIVFVLIVLLIVGSFTACQRQTSIESQDQAVKETITIGSDVDDVGVLLDDIDSDLG